MTIYKYSLLTNNQTIAFNPPADVLQFDTTAISAAQGTVTQVGADLVFNYAGKTFTFTNFLLEKLTTADVTFDNGSLLIVGDNTVGTVNDAAANLLTGGAGNDRLYGLGGNDTLNGNAGNDVLIGGTGNDTMTGGAGNDTYVVDSSADVVTETSTLVTEIDTVNSSIGYALKVNVENLTLTGTAINGIGNSLNNNLIGNAVDNNLTGSTGNDTLNGADGVDSLIGGTGNDIYMVDSTTDIITESSGQGTDTVQSSVSYTLSAELENLTLTGSAPINGTGNSLNNILTGNSANNALVSGAGNDTLNGSGGDSDTLTGGLGNDVYVVDSTTDIITESVGQGIDTVQSSANYTLSNLQELENLTLTGSAINGTGNALNNTLTGNAVDNSLTGGAGTDTLNGAGGVDTLIGGLGNDTYVVDTTTDTITETAGQGTDVVQSSVDYTLAAEVENLTLTGAAAIDGTGNTLNNTLTGNSGNNILQGDVGNDTLNGAGGVDSLLGGVGNDTYIVDTTTDVITETAGQGTDTVQSGVNYTLSNTQELENLTLTGTAVNGTGNALSNTLTGNAVNNTLTGGAGNDVINGAAGIDNLIGGLGNDSYIVDSTTDTITETAGQGTDTIQSSVNYTLSAQIEYLKLTGAAAINGTGNTLNNILTGNAANNLLEGDIGTDTVSYAYLASPKKVSATLDASGNSIATVTNGATVIETDTLTDIENLTGGAGGDTLTGNSGNNILSGGAGNDSLIGGLGSDTVSYSYLASPRAVNVALDVNGNTMTAKVTNGATVVETDNLTGIENLVGGAGDDTLAGNSSSNILNGNLGVDTLIGKGGNDFYIVDTTTDTITEVAGQGIDTVQSSVNYTLSNEVENLILTGAAIIDGAGNSLNNILTGNVEDNTLDGNGGSDTVSYSYLTAPNKVNAVLDLHGNSTATVTNGVTVVESDNLLAIENLIAGAGNDTLVGNNSNNILDGGLGNDSLTGGLGNDTYIINTTADVITELSFQGADTVQSSVSYNLTTFAPFCENITLTGSAITAIGNTGDNHLTGNAADNQLEGFVGLDMLVGDAGNDTLRLNDFLGDSVDGGAGVNDQLHVYGGNQFLRLGFSTISNVETIDFDSANNNYLAVSKQSILNLSSDNDTLTVDGTGTGNTLAMDSGWTDTGISGGYHTFTNGTAQLNVNSSFTIEQSPVSYTISNATTAANVGAIFNSGIQIVKIDFGGKLYTAAGLSAIDLSGFGLEDQLVISHNDGLLQNTSVHYHTNSNPRVKYIHELTAATPLKNEFDSVSWRPGATKAAIISATQIGHIVNNNTVWSANNNLASIQLTGLPLGLPDSHFVFI